MAENGTKARRVTWVENRPEGADDPRVISREQLLAEVRRQGIHVSDRMFESWQQLGVIPYGIRQWHEGKPASMFPDWMVDRLISLRRMQDLGIPLKEIAKQKALWNWPPVMFYAGPVESTLDDKAAFALAGIALEHEEENPGIIIKSAAVSFHDENGNIVLTRSFTLPIGRI